MGSASGGAEFQPVSFSNFVFKIISDTIILSVIIEERENEFE